jgi:epoxyqueuosine reductase
MVKIKKILQTFAQKNNIIIGACHAAPLEKEQLLASPFVPFVSGDIEKRTNPVKSLQNVENIIVIGAGNEAGYVNLSSLGINADYHVRVKNLLRKLVEELKTQHEFEYKILVDSPALDERAIAHRAGLGFFGKNGLLISEKFGSRFNIGCLLVSTHSKVFAELFSKSSWGCGGNAHANSTYCENCNLCIKACPTGALGGDALKTKQCISYLTQKDDLIPEEEKLIAQAGQLYGCDICQDVCPLNNGIFTEEEEYPLMADFEEIMQPENILEMDEETYKSLVNPRFWYIGEEGLWKWKCNALRVLINEGDEKYHPLIKKYCDHEDERISQVAREGWEELQKLS